MDRFKMLEQKEINEQLANYYLPTLQKFFLPLGKILKFNILEDYSFLENKFAFYFSNVYPIGGKLKDLSYYYKKIFQNTSGNFYIIHKDILVIDDEFRAYHYIFPIKKGFIDIQNIKVLTNFEEQSIKPEIFYNKDKIFATILNKNYIINDIIKNLFINQEIIKSNPEIKIHTYENISFGALIYGIYDKYGGLTDKFIEDLNNMKQKIVEIYRQYDKYNSKAENKKINPNYYISLNLNAIYILLTNDYRIFLKPKYSYEDNIITIHEMENYYSFNVLKGNSLEELAIKHLLHIELNKNKIDFMNYYTAEDFLNKVMDIHKKVFNNDLHPDTYKILKDKVIETIQQYKKEFFNTNKSAQYEEEFVLDFNQKSFNKIFETLENKLKLEVVYYKKENVYPRVFGKQLGL